MLNISNIIWREITLKKHQVVRDLKKFENHWAKWTSLFAEFKCFV